VVIASKSSITRLMIIVVRLLSVITGYLTL